MTIRDLCHRARALCEQIAARDLGDVPLYIVPQSMLASEYGTASRMYGCWSPCADLYYRDTIGADWRGRGACLLVNDIALREDFGDENLELLFFATTLHELGHTLEGGVFYRDRPELTAAQVDPEYAAARVKSSPLRWPRSSLSHHRHARHKPRSGPTVGDSFAHACTSSIALNVSACMSGQRSCAVRVTACRTRCTTRGPLAANHKDAGRRAFATSSRRRRRRHSQTCG